MCHLMIMYEHLDKGNFVCWWLNGTEKLQAITCLSTLAITFHLNYLVWHNHAQLMLYFHLVLKGMFDYEDSSFILVRLTRVLPLYLRAHTHTWTLNLYASFGNVNLTMLFLIWNWCDRFKAEIIAFICWNGPICICESYCNGLVWLDNF